MIQKFAKISKFFAIFWINPALFCQVNLRLKKLTLVKKYVTIFLMHMIKKLTVNYIDFSFFSKNKTENILRIKICWYLQKYSIFFSFLFWIPMFNMSWTCVVFRIVYFGICVKIWKLFGPWPWVLLFLLYTNMERILVWMDFWVLQNRQRIIAQHVKNEVFTIRPYHLTLHFFRQGSMLLHGTVLQGGQFAALKETGFFFFFWKFQRF